MSQVRRQGLAPVWQAFEASSERCYLSIDIDALDPSLAPGTGSPDPDGFQHWQVAEIAWTLAQRTQIVAFDLVEVNPLVDTSGLTASVAAMIILETWEGFLPTAKVPAMAGEHGHDRTRLRHPGMSKTRSRGADQVHEAGEGPS